MAWIPRLALEGALLTGGVPVPQPQDPGMEDRLAGGASPAEGVGDSAGTAAEAAVVWEVALQWGGVHLVEQRRQVSVHLLSLSFWFCLFHNLFFFFAG